MSEDLRRLQAKIQILEQEVAQLKQSCTFRGVRKRSKVVLLGLPLYDIAMGPDPTKGEMRGHARGIIAMGDVATGFLAFGGMARGLIAIGGFAIGVVAVGGAAVGGLAVGGAAIGILAVGGAAAGVIAVGGGACGYYACGGGALGKYVVSPDVQSPEAIQFFESWIPGIKESVRRQSLVPPVQ